MFAQIWMGESILVKYTLPAGVSAQMLVRSSSSADGVLTGDDAPLLTSAGWVVHMVSAGTPLAAGFYRLVICTALDTFNTVRAPYEIQVLDLSAMSPIEILTKQIEFIDQKLLTEDPLITRYRSADGREIYRERIPNLILAKKALAAELFAAKRDAVGGFPARTIRIEHG